MKLKILNEATNPNVAEVNPKSWPDDKELTFEEALELAKAYYAEGGDGFYETADANYFDYLVQEFGPQTVGSMKRSFGVFDSVAKDRMSNEGIVESTSINEGPLKNAVNVDRGYRIKEIKKLRDTFADDVEAAGYKAKAVGDDSLHIQPKYGYLAKLEVTMDDSQGGLYSVKMLNVFGKTLKLASGEFKGKVPQKLTGETLVDITDDIGTTLASTLISPSNFKNLSESLTEDTILEYGPLFNKLKGFFKELPDKVDTAVANRSERQGNEKILNTLNEELTESLNNVIDSLTENGKKYVTVESTVNNTKLVIELKSSFVLSISFGTPVGQDADSRKVTAKKILTPLGEVQKLNGKKVILVPLDSVLDAVGKVLYIKFYKAQTEYKDSFEGDDEEEDQDIADTDTSDQDESDTDSSAEKDVDDDEIKDPDDDSDNENDIEDPDDQPKTKPKNKKYADWSQRIGDAAWDALQLERLNIKFKGKTLNEAAYPLKTKASLYAKAYNKAEDADAKLALVQFFLLRETDGVLTDATVKKIDMRSISRIQKLCTAAAFNPNASMNLLYVLTYIKKKKTITAVPLGVAEKLPDVCKKDKRIVENEKSVIYSDVLFKSSNDPDDLIKLINCWFGQKAFSAAVIEKFTDELKEELSSNFDINSRFDSTPVSQTTKIKQYLLLDEDLLKFRELQEINAIKDMINASIKNKDKPEKTNPEDSSDDEEQIDGDSEDIINNFANGEVENIDSKAIDSLLKAAKEQGADTDSLNNAIVQAVLTALGKTE